VSAALRVRADGHATKDRVWQSDIDPNDANRITPIQQELGVVSSGAVVRMILVVHIRSASRLEQDVATDVVIAAPGRSVSG
jgi:hypothetical protein